ncbi:MAG: hypothetical protein M1546_26555 [Chloroflexi bacterium]|nr:hypothetical protein [Chloroflexota bacterium]
MNSTFRRILVIAAVIAAAGLVLFIGNNAVSAVARGSGPNGWTNMMGGYGNNQSASGWMGGMMGYTRTLPNGSGMMGSDAMKQMMGNTGMMSNGTGMMNGGMMGYTGTLPYGTGAMHGDMGAMMGMMSGTMMTGTMPHRPGMMMGFGSSALLGIKPLSIDHATTAVNGYLTELGNKDLVLAEVMVFDNHAYGRIIEQSTGAGALEVLVDPVTQAVYPEPGPNMMWNAKYGHMNGMMGMMGSTAREATTAMPVSATEAIKAAQAYLDENLPGAKTAEDAETFYGYYTIDILRDGKVAGMLSVNGYTSQVFVHTWHGNFIEMSEGGR